MGLEVFGGFYFKFFIVVGIDEGVVSEGMFEVESEFGERVDGEVIFGDGLFLGSFFIIVLVFEYSDIFKCDFVWLFFKLIDS